MKYTAKYIRENCPQVMKEIKEMARAELIKEGKLLSPIQRRIQKRAGTLPKKEK